MCVGVCLVLRPGPACAQVARASADPSSARLLGCSARGCWGPGPGQSPPAEWPVRVDPSHTPAKWMRSSTGGPNIGPGRPRPFPGDTEQTHHSPGSAYLPPARRAFPRGALPRVARRHRCRAAGRAGARMTLGGSQHKGFGPRARARPRPPAAPPVSRRDSASCPGSGNWSGDPHRGN